MEIGEVKKIEITKENIDMYSNKAKGLVLCPNDIIHFYSIDKATQKVLYKIINYELKIDTKEVDIECVQINNKSMKTNSLLYRVYSKEKESYISFDIEKRDIVYTEEEIIDKIYKYIDSTRISIESDKILKIFNLPIFLILSIIVVIGLSVYILIERKIDIFEILVLLTNIAVVIVYFIDLIIKKKKE